MTEHGRLNINPGEYYFGSEYAMLYTLLGSCVAVTCWHPKFFGWAVSLRGTRCARG